MQYQSHQSMTQKLNLGKSWTQSSIAIKIVERDFIKKNDDEDSDYSLKANIDKEKPEKSARYYQLFKFATTWEKFLMFLGVILAFINGSLLPLANIVYGEFTNLLIDRTVGIGTSTKSPTMEWFGGGQILTNASQAANRDALLTDSRAFGIGTLVVSFLQFIAAVISVNLFNYTALKQINRIKEEFLRAVLRQDITWYDLNTSMNFATKVTDVVEKFQEGIAEKVPMFLYLIMSFVSSVVIAFAFGWKLTLVVLSTTPIVMITTLIIGYLQLRLTTKELKAYSVAGMIAEEVLGSIRTVVAFAGEDKEVERFSERLMPTHSIGNKKGVYAGIGNSCMWLMLYASYAISFWYGVRLILESRGEKEPTYTAAVLMIIFINVLQGALNVGLTTPHLEAMSNARASASSIYAILDRKPVIDSLSTAGERPVLDGDIEFDNVYFKYPARQDVQVLNGLSLKIRKGETVALVGQSGCGKSTCLQLIQRLYDVDSGQVLISGHNVKTMNVHHLRKHIAVVGQEPVLFAGTIMENIRMSNPSCTDEEVIIASRQAYCHKFIRSLPDGYDTLIGDRGAHLSGGQKQRIAIARALVRKSMILLLDEATSALDSQSEAKVQRALDDAAAGRTTIIVSHRLSTVLKADRIVFLKKGKVIEQGTHEELMQLKGYFYRLATANEPSVVIGLKPSTSIGSKDLISKVSQQVSDSDTDKKFTKVSMASQTQLGSKSESTVLIKIVEEEKPFVPTNWQILKLCKPEKYLMLMGVFAALAVGTSFPMYAVLFGEVYGILESRDENKVMQEANEIALYFIGVGIFTAVFIFIQIYLFNLTGVKLTARLRTAAFRSMLAQEIGWFDDPKNTIGALCARLASDAAAVQGATGTRIGALMCAFSTIFVGACLSFYYTWSMTLVSSTAVPLVIGAVVLESRVLAQGAALVRESSDQATTIATEAISNIRTVCAFCGEENTLARYREADAKARKHAIKRLRWRGVVFGFGQTIPISAYAIALWYGGIMVANKEIHYKEIIKVSEAMIFGAIMIGQALAFAPNFGAAIQAAGRVMSLLARKPKVTSTKTPLLFEDFLAKGKIDYENVRFRYPTRTEVEVLQGLSLAVPAGKRIALVGTSGCGKSTLLQLLQRLYDPEEGNVFLDDYNIYNDMRLSTLRRNLSIVSQEPVLFDRTIAENIAYGDNFRIVPIEEIVKCAKAANVHSFISALPEGYDTRVGARASQLSGGQKQRIAIARALIRNPRVLLLDEATSALDTHSEKVVQEALDRASQGRTTLIIAHRLSTIQNADLIIVIDQGVVAETGTHYELLISKGIYARLYELQQVGHMADND